MYSRNNSGSWLFSWGLLEACAKSPGRIIYECVKRIVVSGKIQVQVSYCERLGTLVGFNPDRNDFLFNSKGAVPEVRSLQSLVQHFSHL